MRQPILLLPFCLLLAIAAPAQSEGRKPDADPKKPGATEPRKDDKTTAKDPAIVAIDKFIQKKGPAKKQHEWRTGLAKPPKLTLDATKDYFWRMQTNKGEIGVRLLPEAAPMHVSSTIYLARLGFYDDLAFHRVITGFMAQGGCPLGTGRGGPGYHYDGEFDPKVRHDRAGLLSMANAGPGTDGSQFFLTFAPASHLDDKHTIFGEVLDGKEVLKALEAAGSESGKPGEELVIEQTWIVVVPAAVEPAEPGKDKGGNGKDGG